MSSTLERIGGVKAYDETGWPRSFEVFRDGNDYCIYLDGEPFIPAEEEISPDGEEVSGKMKHSEAIETITAEISARGWTRGGGRA